MTPLGVFAILFCLLNAKMSEGSFPYQNGPVSGRYFSRFWPDVENILNAPPLLGIFELRSTGHDTYNGNWSWVGTGTTFTGFYSSNTNTLTGAWYSEGLQLWGAMYYHWNGISFSGRSTFSHNGTVAYEVLLPVDSSFELPAMTEVSPEDAGK